MTRPASAGLGASGEWNGMSTRSVPSGSTKKASPSTTRWAPDAVAPGSGAKRRLRGQRSHATSARIRASTGRRKIPIARSEATGPLHHSQYSASCQIPATATARSPGTLSEARPASSPTGATR